MSDRVESLRRAPYGSIAPSERPVLFWRGVSDENEGMLLSGILVSPAELDAARQSPPLDELRRGVSAGIILRLIHGDTDQRYTPTEVSAMVNEVLDQQYARLAVKGEQEHKR